MIHLMKTETSSPWAEFVSRLAALTAAMLLVATTAVSGCGTIGHLRDVMTSPILPVEAPDANLANSPVVAAMRGRVVKIRGSAHSCQKLVEGSGFVVSPNRVMSTAHDVAGTDSVSVEVDGTRYNAQVVSYDPGADISILDVPNLTAQPLNFAQSPVTSGTDTLLLGYPDGVSFIATPARIREITTLDDPDIYRTTTVTRVYDETAERSEKCSTGAQ
jgi:S1-C subfamily serine protease